MKKCIALFLFLVLTLSSYAQNLDGKWKGTFSGPDGEMSLLYTIKTDTGKLTGNVTSDMGSLPLENGKVNGKEFSFDITFNGQTMGFTGTVNGDKIKLSNQMMPEPTELTRVTEGSKTELTKVAEGSKIAGKWLGKASSPQGEFELTFTFNVDGTKLTGKNSSSMGEVELSNGVVNGNDFSFDVDMQGMNIPHKCKYLDDDSIEVKVNVMDQEMVMKLKRVAQ